MKKIWVLPILVILGAAALLLLPKPVVTSYSTAFVAASDEDCIKAYDDFRAGSYNGPMVNGIPQCVFKNLPEKPDDFTQVMTMLKANMITMPDFCIKLNASYWMQPDFYPTADKFYDLEKNPITDADGTLRRGVYGYGSFISELIASVSPGESFSTCVDIHSSWYIWTWQSMGFGISYPNTATFRQNSWSDGNRSVTQVNASRYFTTEITPEYALFGPTWPVVSKEWAHQVKINIHVSPDTPKGRYMLVLSPSGTIPESVDNEWLWKYKTNYIRGSGFYQDLLMLGVEVV